MMLVANMEPRTMLMVLSEIIYNVLYVMQLCAMTIPTNLTKLWAQRWHSHQCRMSNGIKQWFLYCWLLKLCILSIDTIEVHCLAITYKVEFSSQGFTSYASIYEKLLIICTYCLICFSFVLPAFRVITYVLAFTDYISLSAYLHLHMCNTLLIQCS